jgi:hypothetical protein
MEELFPSISKSVASKSVTDNTLFRPTFESVEYKIDQIRDKVNNIDNLDEHEIKNIIIRQYHTILNYDLFLSPERDSALQLFTNETFIKLLTDLIGILDLSNDEIICINKITYDYYLLPENEKSKTVSELLLELSYKVNNKQVIKLSAIIGMTGARILAMVVNSSFKIEKNIHRLNTFIVKCNISLSIQDIINIYCIVFDRLMYPIIYTMLEVPDSNLTSDQVVRFRAISTVVLKLLDAMTSEDIYKVISNYAYILQLSCVTETRFSLEEACKVNKLGRILNIINQVKSEIEDCPVCI